MIPQTPVIDTSIDVDGGGGGGNNIITPDTTIRDELIDEGIQAAEDDKGDMMLDEGVPVGEAYAPVDTLSFDDQYQEIEDIPITKLDQGVPVGEAYPPEDILNLDQGVPVGEAYPPIETTSVSAPYGVNPETGIPYETPRTIADQNRVLGIVTEEDAANPKGLLERIGLGNLNPAKTAVMAAINKAVGAPVSLLITALEALPQYEPTFEERTLEGELGVTTDGKFAGNPNTSAFAGLNAVSAFGDPVETAKNRIDTRLKNIENKNYSPGDKFYDDTQTMIEEYNRVTNKLGDIDAIPTGDVQIAEETIGTLPEITETRQEQGEQIQEIQQQEVVQSGSDEADKQQKDTGVAKVAENRYETKSGDVYASAAEAAEKGDGGSGGGGKTGCVIATHAVNSGAFTKDTKREAVRWCVKNLHRTWWGEAVRKGYRYYGQKAIDEGKAKNYYQEFKDYVAFGTGKRRTLKTGWTFVYRTVQFFLKGLTL
jgi:hypothetical protein